MILHERYVKAHYAITGASVIFLIIMTSLNQNSLFLDEDVFLKNMPLFEEAGLSEKFLLEMYDQAPGPLYQLVQSSFKPLTSLQSPGIRLVNVFFFILVIVNTAFLLKFSKVQVPNLLIALNLIAVPVMWQVAGMALTEVPAMFFATLALVILGIMIQSQQQATATNGVLALLGGICLGAAILGRTQYLMLVPAICILGFNPFAEKKLRQSISLFHLSIFVFTALAICLPVFIIWKGLLPPYQAIIGEGGLRIWHGVLAFAYAGIIVVIIAPRWFKINRTIIFLLIASFVILAVLDFFWFRVNHQPLHSFLSGVLPPSVMNIYPHLISPLLMVFAGYFGYSLILNIVSHRNNAYYLAIAFSLVFVLMTCIKITHLFTSRYVAQAAPFLIVLLAEKDSFDKYKILRVCIGIVIGYISLHTYVYP